MEALAILAHSCEWVVHEVAKLCDSAHSRQGARRRPASSDAGARGRGLAPQLAMILAVCRRYSALSDQLVCALRVDACAACFHYLQGIRRPMVHNADTCRPRSQSAIDQTLKGRS